MSGGLTLCTFNAGGLRAAEARGFSRWLARRQPDVLALQELRCRPDQVAPKLVSPAGYNARWNPAQRPGYAGVALYSRVCGDRYLEGSGLEWADAEGRVLRADLGPLTVVSLYVPSGSHSEERQALKMAWLAHFSDFARGLLAEGREVVLCGDFNIAHTPLDIHAPKRNERNSGFLPEERAWLSTFLEQGWVDVVRALHPGVPGLYSWWSARGRAREKDLGWRLDYVLASPRLAERAREAWIDGRPRLSDHAPVCVRFEL